MNGFLSFGDGEEMEGECHSTEAVGKAGVKEEEEEETRD